MMMAEMPGMAVMSEFNILSGNPVSKLKERAEEILDKNRWLMGRTRKSPKTKLNEIAIYTKFLEKSEYIKIVTDDKCFTDSYQEKVNQLNTYNIPMGKYIKPNEALSKFVFISNRNKSKLIILFSISHMIADGSTMYNIFNMMDLDRKVREMKYIRTQYWEVLKKETSLASPTGELVMMSNFGTFMVGMFGKMLCRRSKQFYRPRSWLYELDTDYIQKTREKYSNEAPVSSNDVITWWLSTLNKKCDFVEIACDLRNRLSILDADNAGNYIDTICVEKDNLSSPLSVRKRLQSAMEPGGQTEPRTTKAYKKYLGGMTTNWATFFHKFNLPGCKFVDHAPLLDMSPNSVETMFGCFIPFEEFAVIYKRDDNRMAVLLTVGSGQVTNMDLEKSPILGKRICRMDFFNKEPHLNYLQDAWEAEKKR